MPSNQEIKHTDKRSRFIGGGLTLAFHLLLMLCFFTVGFKTIYPPPQELGILVEFPPEPEPVIPQAIPDAAPRTPKPKPNREVVLVQRSVHTEVVPTTARTQQSTLGKTGDVALTEPPPPKPINQRALFRSRDTGDSLAEQGSRAAGSTMRAGDPDGNTVIGNPNGTPSATLAGRSVVGSLPLPEYKTNTGGAVIVRILVDQHGNVTRAQAGMAGTTVQDRTLWNAAAKAALEAKFNMSASAPVAQEGTITYVFILK